MANPGTDESYPDIQDWDNDTKTMACSLIKALDFEFLMSFTTTYRVLAIMEGIIITTRLQSSSVDIYDAFVWYMYVYPVCMSVQSGLVFPQSILNLQLQLPVIILTLQVDEVGKEFEHVRGDVDKFAEQCFNQACQMAVSVQIDPSYPKVTARQ